MSVSKLNRAGAVSPPSSQLFTDRRPVPLVSAIFDATGRPILPPRPCGSVRSFYAPGLTVSAVLAISLPLPYLIYMCNLTALFPDRPAAKRHKCGTAAVLKRSRTAKSAPPQRTKVSSLRYLCGPNCGISLDAGTAWPRLASFFGLRPLQTWVTHLENE